MNFVSSAKTAGWLPVVAMYDGAVMVAKTQPTTAAPVLAAANKMEDQPFHGGASASPSGAAIPPSTPPGSPNPMVGGSQPFGHAEKRPRGSDFDDDVDAVAGKRRCSRGPAGPGICLPWSLWQSTPIGILWIIGKYDNLIPRGHGLKRVRSEGVLCRHGVWCVRCAHSFAV